jgi:hypothetical protein
LSISGIIIVNNDIKISIACIFIAGITYWNVGFEVLMAANIKMAVFWVVAFQMYLLPASIIRALMMEAASISETLANFYHVIYASTRLHGAKTQKTAIFDILKWLCIPNKSKIKKLTKSDNVIYRPSEYKCKKLTISQNVLMSGTSKYKFGLSQKFRVI